MRLLSQTYMDAIWKPVMSTVDVIENIAIRKIVILS